MGVVVGRFQCKELHEGHRFVLDRVFRQHTKVVIFLGVSPMISKKNPMDFQTRFLMLKEVYPNAMILPLSDHRDDKIWSKELDRQIGIIHKHGPAKLYGGRDCFFSHYAGKYEFEAFVADKKIGDISATEQRNQLGKVALTSAEFRHGVIYARENTFSNPFPTVDIAPVAFHDGVQETEQPFVVMASKPGESTVGFVGGMVDPQDKSYEEAACRELKEETHLYATSGEMKYLGSYQIPDWRLSAGIGITTSFFMVLLENFKNAHADDDIESLTIVPISELALECNIKVAAAHDQLRKRLLNVQFPLPPRSVAKKTV
jgi:bifunctional NMN adenylyltransferase/nudix hydrolase